jgi:hypothetical protein
MCVEICVYRRRMDREMTMSKYTINESWLVLLHDAIFFDLPRDYDTE